MRSNVPGARPPPHRSTSVSDRVHRNFTLQTHPTRIHYRRCVAYKTPLCYFTGTSHYGQSCVAGRLIIAGRAGCLETDELLLAVSTLACTRFLEISVAFKEDCHRF